MVLIGLLLIALVCLALGLVLASAGWLIGSLAASAAAAWVLWRGRDRIGPVTETAKADRAESMAGAGAAQPVSALATATLSPEAGAAETPAAADYARRRADELAAGSQPPAAVAPTSAAPVAPAATETTLVDVDVWVIDGRPNYHTPHCGVLLGTEPESIPRSQAVEDGFTPCTLCDPDAHPERVVSTVATAQQPPVEAVGPGDLRQVLVVDGWPHYHAQGCARIAGARSEPIPFGQAVQDGFTPCPDCQPAVIEPATAQPSAPAQATAPPEQVLPEPAVPAEPEPEPEPAVSAEPVLESAAEPVAEPEPVEPAIVSAEPAAAEPPAAEPVAAEPAAIGDVWVVPGRPRFHVQGCMILGDQGAIAVPYAQAVDDGFKPCSLCEPI